MSREMGELIQFRCWDVVGVLVSDIPKYNIIDTKWMLKINKEKNVVKVYRARCVTKGYMEKDKGVELTYAPTSFLVTIKVYLTVVAVHDWEMVKIDFTSAFIQAPISEDIFVWPPEGFQCRNDPGYITLYKLNKGWLSSLSCNMHEV